MPMHLPVVSKKTAPTIQRRRLNTLDRVVIVVSFLYPLSGLPQVIAVFSGRTEGVAVLSWMTFLVCASLFLTYGIRRSIPPMIIANTLWIAIDALVIIGVFVSGSHVTWL